MSVMKLTLCFVRIEEFTNSFIASGEKLAVRLINYSPDAWPTELNLRSSLHTIAGRHMTKIRVLADMICI